MSAHWKETPPPQGYTVTHFDRGRGGYSALHSMAGPEFTGVGAVYSPIGMLPPMLRLAAFAVLILIGMAGCTAAWVDYQDYTPSLNICSQDQLGTAAELSGDCVVPTAPGVAR